MGVRAVHRGGWGGISVMGRGEGRLQGEGGRGWTGSSCRVQVYWHLYDTGL